MNWKFSRTLRWGKANQQAIAGTTLFSLSQDQDNLPATE